MYIYLFKYLQTTSMRTLFINGLGSVKLRLKIPLKIIQRIKYIFGEYIRMSDIWTMLFSVSQLRSKTAQMGRGFILYIPKYTSILLTKKDIY